MRYNIYEENMERLEKKLTRISNKCAKYGCSFKYEKVGEEFHKNEDGEVLRYVVVEVEGKAEVNDWEFVASIDFTENGNIINKANSDMPEVPERYYTSQPICEHCNTNKRRKYGYIIRNTVTGEFKQVGKSCLKDFTGGLDAEVVASYIQLFDELIVGEAPYEGCRIINYFETEVYLQYVVECVNKFGFYKKDSERSTACRAEDYLLVQTGRMEGKWLRSVKERCLKEIEQSNFKHDTEENIKVAKEALEWIAGQEEDSNYIHNVKVACSLEYIDDTKFGLVASLIPTYFKAVERKLAYEKKAQEAAEQGAKSQHIGTVGSRIKVDVEAVECIASWETQYGVTKVYKITDGIGNVYTWKTSNYLNDCKQLVGTVKAHNEFRGVKQTELTRCKVVA